MTIDPINPPKKVFSTQKNAAVRASSKPNKPDEVSISTEAKQEAFLKRVRSAVREAPDIRASKVQQAKKNLEQYIDSEGQIRPDVLRKMANLLSELPPKTG